MTDEQVPDVEDIKTRLKEEIPVEEDVGELKTEEAADMTNGVAMALRELGHQFARTMRTAWDSEERKEVEWELRQGMKDFADEMDRVIKEARESPAGQRVQQEASEFKTSVESGDATQKARSSIVQGLHWLSDELSSLADQFSPPEKEPEE